MNRRIAGPAALAAGALALYLGGCAATDIVAKYAASSFTALVEASAERLSRTEGGDAWTLASPGGDRIAFSTDFSRALPAAAAGAPAGAPDIELSFDLAPFAAAGLDPARLPAPTRGGQTTYAAEGGRLLVRAELGDEAFPAEAARSLEAAFAAILKAHRASIGYHEALGHYGIRLGGGNMFEWAKDLAKNDKDIVFVLNPEPFIAAGVDPAKVVGWVFAKVPVDIDGKPTEVDKLLKPFSLK